MKRILLGHGGGGRLSRELVECQILPRFGEGPLAGLPDAASLPGGLRFTTDGFVVQPLFFPGGCIGDLCVHGTVNDLAVSGARPQWLSLAMVLEEGLPLDVLGRVLDAIQAAAQGCGVVVATGDTKVVPRGQCDGLYITTAGIGHAIPGLELAPDRVLAGDVVLVSGPLGDHGMAVLAARNQLPLQGGPVSDSASVRGLVEGLADLGPAIRFLRDPTRGGLAAVVCELVEGRPLCLRLHQPALPFDPRTRSVAELLGIELLSVACEGRVVCVCDPAVSDEVLRRWRGLPEGVGAAQVGVVEPGRGRVLLATAMGAERIVTLPHGELLPRIC